jgi:hypothetical protein
MGKSRSLRASANHDYPSSSYASGYASKNNSNRSPHCDPDYQHIASILFKYCPNQELRASLTRISSQNRVKLEAINQTMRTIRETKLYNYAKALVAQPEAESIDNIDNADGID